MTSTDHHCDQTDRELTRTAVSATVHCLTGCAIGEVLGLALATWWGWSDWPSILLAVVLAFFFGYSLTLTPVLRSGLPLRAAVGVALAADTVSILTMELVDNGVMLAVPGAMEAGLADLLFWGSLAFSLAVAFVVTVPVNRALISAARATRSCTRTTTDACAGLATPGWLGVVATAYGVSAVLAVVIAIHVAVRLLLVSAPSIRAVTRTI